MTIQINAAEQRLAWLVAAMIDPSAVTVDDIDAAYNVEWNDWTSERELEFLRSGHFSGSRPLTLVRVVPGEEGGATAILLGADEKRWSVTCWVEPDEPHRLTGVRTVPAPPDGMEIRLATLGDGPVLAELERRAPLRLGREPLTFMTFDHGDDYFAPSRLMEEVTIYVAELGGKVCGVYCGAVQPVEVEGERKHLFLEHHVRIDPDAPRGGVFWALCSFGRDRYARSSDSIAFYVSPENYAVRKFVEGTPGWTVQPLRALLPCRADDDVDAEVRIATAADASEIVETLNSCHSASALFAPYTESSLAARLTRDAAQYGWPHVARFGGAVIGVGRDLVTVTKECEGAVTVTKRAQALDHGFAPGAHDDYRAVLRWKCRDLAARGATHLAVFTSEHSATYDVVAGLAEVIEPFDFWAFNIPEPPALAAGGFYVDPVYF